MTFQAYHRARRMGLALNQVRQGIAWIRRETGVALNLRAVSATRSQDLWRIANKRQDACTTVCGANRFAARANDRCR